MFATWLDAAGASAQAADGPTSAPITPPGYVPAATLGQGVPYATAPSPEPGPRVELREHTESIRGVWIPALIVLPVSWIMTWAVASTTTRLEGDAIELSYIPIVGPWLVLGQPTNGDEGFYVAAGIFQGASALALALGLAIRRTVREQVWVGGELVDLDVGVHVTPGPGGASATLTF